MFLIPLQTYVLLKTISAKLNKKCIQFENDILQQICKPNTSEKKINVHIHIKILNNILLNMLICRILDKTYIYIYIYIYILMS